MRQIDLKANASKGNVAILLSENVQVYEQVAADCTRIGLRCVLIGSEDEGLEWLWASGRQLRMVVLDDEFKLREDDSFPVTLARDWADVSVIKLSTWRDTLRLRTASRKA